MVWLSAKCFRNRAIDGDTVTVRLLPTAQWKGRLTSLAYSGMTKDSLCDKVSMPTGVVVGIVQRGTRPIVATFSVSIVLLATVIWEIIVV